MDQMTWDLLLKCLRDAKQTVAAIKSTIDAGRCGACGGQGQLALSREPCSTSTYDCPDCNGKGYK
jgi:excinuclease UvrABC ATPase subunit